MQTFDFDTLLNTKHNILTVFFCQCRKSYRNIRYIDTFSLP